MHFRFLQEFARSCSVRSQRWICRPPLICDLSTGISTVSAKYVWVNGLCAEELLCSDCIKPSTPTTDAGKGFELLSNSGNHFLCATPIY